jgi:hypothetical protein
VASDLVPGDTNGTSDVFVRDLRRGVTRLVARGRHGVQGDGYSTALGISSRGRYVLFTSQATNMVRGDTNGVDDVFLVRVRRH